ncbi:MAG: chemotaxis protein MotB [Moorella sp. (in: firmicutes)]|jgi:flagellar motor protein MotB|nr:chemotaxis protein MotB [Moorella sp. (in: firmicutes)]
MRRIGGYFSVQEAENGDNYSLSISDLMSSLLIIFVLALSYFMLSYSQKTAVLVENEDKRLEILTLLEEKLKKQGIEVKVVKEMGILRLPEGILFDPGEAAIKASGLKAISILAPTLKEILNNPRYKESIETIFIEGHTDSDPIRSGKFPSNWELSAQRAINTWQELSKVEPELEQLRNRNGQPFFSISGYADRRPVAPNDTPENKQQNRRIDVRITMIPPQKEK